MSHIKLYEEFLNEGLDEAGFRKLHQEIVKLLQKNPKIETVQHHGPEPSKYSPDSLVSDFSARAPKQDGYQDGLSFKLTHRPKYIELFVPDQGYYQYEKKVSAKEVLDRVKQEGKSKML